MPASITAWSIAIVAEDATIEEPAMPILSRLMPAKTAAINPFKATSTATTPRSVLNSGLISSLTPSTDPVGYTPVNYAPIEPIAPQSSPFNSEIDPVERLSEFFAWLTRISPSLTQEYRHAKGALLSKGHTLYTLPTVTVAEYEGMDINPGIYRQLDIHLRKFKKKEAAMRIS
jgi:hypothetical protein